MTRILTQLRYRASGLRYRASGLRCRASGRRKGIARPSRNQSRGAGDAACQRMKSANGFFLMENFVPPCGIGTFHPLAKRKLTKRIPMTFGVWSFGQLRAGGRQIAVVGRSSDLTGGSPLGAPASRRQMRVRQMFVYTTPPAGGTPALPGAAFNGALKSRSRHLLSCGYRRNTSLSLLLICCCRSQVTAPWAACSPDLGSE